MKYKDLIEVMHQYRMGNADKDDMIAAFALWQKPLIDYAGYDKSVIIRWMIE